MWQFTGKQRPEFAETPGPGQESVWDYPRPPALEVSRRRVLVSHAGQVLADTSRAWRLLETASPPSYYIPLEDVNIGLLRPMAGRSSCEWKGAASYWGLPGDAEGEPVAWCYPDPNQGYAELRDAVCFYPGRVECRVDGERVQPQPGHFYGGWITRELVGPCKGEPGTGHW